MESAAGYGAAAGQQADFRRRVRYFLCLEFIAVPRGGVCGSADPAAVAFAVPRFEVEIEDAEEYRA